MVHFSSLPRDIRADAPLWGEIRDLLPGSLATVRVSMLDDLGRVGRVRPVIALTGTEPSGLRVHRRPTLGGRDWTRTGPIGR